MDSGGVAGGTPKKDIFANIFFSQNITLVFFLILLSPTGALYAMVPNYNSILGAPPQ